MLSPRQVAAIVAAAVGAELRHALTPGVARTWCPEENGPKLDLGVLSQSMWVISWWYFYIVLAVTIFPNVWKLSIYIYIHIYIYLLTISYLLYHSSSHWFLTKDDLRPSHPRSRSPDLFMNFCAVKPQGWVEIVGETYPTDHGGFHKWGYP